MILRGAGERPIRVYQPVRRLTKLNAKQAKELVDSAPQSILGGYRSLRPTQSRSNSMRWAGALIWSPRRIGLSLDSGVAPAL